MKPQPALLYQHLSAWLTERLPQEMRASAHTLATYRHAWRLLVEFAARTQKKRPSQLALHEVNAELVLEWLKYLEMERGNRPQTRNARLAAVKSFFRYVEWREPGALAQVQRILALPSKRSEKRLTPFLSQEEMQALLDAVQPVGRTGLRDGAMLLVTLDLGLRVSEVVGLRMDDMKTDPFPALYIRGKGRRDREMPLKPATARVLRRYLAARPASAIPQLFVSARGEPLTRAGFEYVLARYAKKAREHCPSMRTKRVSPHVLRHSCAMHTLKATGDVAKVALWLGHASIKTTETYLKADPALRLEVMATQAPPSLKSGNFEPQDELLALLGAHSAQESSTERRSPRSHGRDDGGDL